MKTRTVLKIHDGGRRFVVVFHAGTNTNPYWLYEIRTAYEGAYGYPQTRRKLVEKYQNLQSCIYWLSGVPEFTRDYFGAV